MMNDHTLKAEEANMGVYLCRMCDMPRDSDVHGFNDLTDVFADGRTFALCDSCFDRLYEEIEWRDVENRMEKKEET